MAVHGSVPRGLRGGLLHFVRNDRVAFAMTGWRLQRLGGARNDGVVLAKTGRVRKDALLSLRGRRPWQSIVLAQRLAD